MPKGPSPIVTSILKRGIKSESIHTMGLFPKENILTQEIESWKGFADSLPSEDGQTFIKMLNDCYKYSKAINAKGRPFPSEPVIMALLFSQHKVIEWLESQICKVKQLDQK
jgi:hypothetical protein